jgi:dolichol-phosphate mannosyltransferase
MQTAIVNIKSRYARTLKFMLVGLSGTLLDYSLLFMLKAFGTPTLLANTCSASLGMLANFNLNRAWTFRCHARASKSYLRQFVQYLLVSLAGLGINNLLLVGLEAPLGAAFSHASAGFLLAKLTATAGAFIWNYLANMTWTFRETRVCEN